MSTESKQDPRTELVRSKYFSLHPKPLERWLWQQGLPQSAERVFWLHWEEGMRSGDWCSEVPIKRAARDCCIDPSTVTRAYQLLRSRGLIRRQDPGRDASNPFAQATAITEVRLPPELLIELSRSPNRNSTSGIGTPPVAVKGFCRPQEPRVSVPQVPRRSALTREESRQMWSRASEPERSRFFAASRDRMTSLEFDTKSRLSLGDRAELLAQLKDQAVAKPTALAPQTQRHASTDYAGPRRLSVLELARARQRVSSCVPLTSVAEVLRQVIWAIEEGALRRFTMPLALNIALKKIREGAWSKPNRIPPNWIPGAPHSSAQPEQCSAA